jgi:hypothetical protein
MHPDITKTIVAQRADEMRAAAAAARLARRARAGRAAASLALPGSATGDAVSARNIWRRVVGRWATARPRPA